MALFSCVMLIQKQIIMWIYPLHTRDSQNDWFPCRLNENLNLDQSTSLEIKYSDNSLNWAQFDQQGLTLSENILCMF